MAIKAVNDSVGPNGIIPILIVFNIYPQLTKIDLLSLSIAKRTEAIWAVTKEVCCLYIEK